MLKKGQIKFSKKALAIIKPYFIKKKVREFLVVIGPSQTKPSGSKDIYRQLLGIKQNPQSKHRVYATDLMKAKKFLGHSLFKEARLNVVVSPTYGCALYIPKDQQAKYNKIKSPDFDWPTVFLNDEDSACVSEFKRKTDKATAIDLSELISEL